MTLQLQGTEEAINTIIGPPENQDEDDKIINMFFLEKKGKHVVCSGSTAKMVSKFLKAPLMP